jgi:hydroxyethylthiazole kinase
MEGILEKIRKNKPLVHHITNWVTIYDCANMTRAFGALPVMAHSIDESAEMARISSALVLNIGTLTTELIDSMIMAGKSANENGIPVILDAVGVGATKLRDEMTSRILDEISVSVIKGNSSEIARIAGEDVTTKGVEATDVEADLKKLASDLAAKRDMTVVITGKEDIVSDGKKTFVIKNGHEMMGCIVGTGCMAASLLGSFCAVEKDLAVACAEALSLYGIAGEIAAKESKGPGSFKENFYDAVFNLDEGKISEMKKIENI